MADAMTNTTTLNDLIGSIIDAMVQEYSYARSVVKKLVTYKEIDNGYNSITIARWNSIAIGALTQSVTPDALALSTDGVTLTPTERGVVIKVSKTVLRADPFTDLEPYAKTLARALGEDQDSLILAKMASNGGATGFANTINNGGGTADIELEDLRTAVGYLLANNAPMPYYSVLHPVSWSKILPELDDVSAFATPGKNVVEGHGEGMPVAPDGFVAAPYGVPIYLSTKVDAARDTAQTYTNVMFSSEAWALASTFPQRVEAQENKPARCFDVVAWYTQDNAELVDTYGTTIEDQINQ
jgi:hypothetical protein